MSWLNILQFLSHDDADTIEMVCGVTIKDSFIEAGKKIADTLVKLESENRQLKEERDES